MPNKLSNIYERNLDAYLEGHTIIINQGGARSGKTYSILQLIFNIALYSKKPLIISCVGQSMPNVKLGMLRDFKKILEDAGLIPDEIENKTDHIFKIGKCIIEFFSADNTGKVHGPQRDILFVNEIFFIPQDVYDALAVRTAGCKIVDFNPCREFYIHTEIIPNNPHKLITSTYLDNLTNLTQEQVRAIESKKNNQYWWDVYGLGKIGVTEGVIFKNWREQPFPDNLQFIFGADFGFSIDPSTLIKVAIDKGKKEIYVKEYLYQAGLGTDQLYSIFKTHAQHFLIIADCAEDRLISDLKNKGLNIQACEKGAGSISAGINSLLDYTIVVDPESHNLKKELRNYVWLNKGSKLAIDDYNHLLDPLRYCERFLNKPISMPYQVSPIC